MPFSCEISFVQCQANNMHDYFARMQYRFTFTPDDRDRYLPKPHAQSRFSMSRKLSFDPESIQTIYKQEALDVRIQKTPRNPNELHEFKHCCGSSRKWGLLCLFIVLIKYGEQNQSPCTQTLPFCEVALRCYKRSCPVSL